MAAQEGHTERVKILAPLTDNPNNPDNNGETPIYLAALNGFIEIVKVFAPLKDKPNAPNNDACLLYMISPISNQLSLYSIYLLFAIK